MKTQSIAGNTIGILASVLLSAAVVPAAIAGEMLELTEPVTTSAPESRASLIDPVTGEVAIGYDSHYVFRGQVQGENSPWSSIDLNAPIGEYDLDLGAWYMNQIDPRVGSLQPDDELNLSASLGRNVGPVDVTVDYIAYLFPETNQQERHELGLRLETTVGPVDLGGAYYHDFELDSNYFQYWVAKWIELTDRVSLHLDVTLGHFEDNFSNVLLTASLAIQITETMWLEPFISGSIDGGDIVAPNRDDQLFGGASLSVVF